MRSEPTVFIIDDEPAVRDALRYLIESLQYGVETFETAQAFLDVYDPDRPGCLILDVRLPRMTGLQLQERLVADNNALPIIIISGHGDIPMAVRALQAGALTFLEKPFRDQEILDWVQKGMEIDTRRRSLRAERGQIMDRLETLTPREYEIMMLMVAGSANKEIAEECDISVRTVEAHRIRVMEKMHAGSLADLFHMVMVANPE